MRNSATLARLMELTRKCVPFTGDGGQVFVTLPEPPGAVVPIRSPGFRNWLVYKAVSHYQILPTPNAFHAILTLMEALASQNPDGPRLSVFRRVGSRMDGVFPTRILLDLANSDSQYVEISPTGWKLVSGTQARFQTSPTALPLPHPDPNPASSPAPNPRLLVADAPAPTALQPPTPNPQPPTPALKPFLNLPTPADFLRVLAWLLAALRPSGPFPVLILQGPPGAGKTFAARVLRSILDPSSCPLSPIPATARDLLTLARHHWILAFDHVSAISPPVADALCSLSSGLGAPVQEAVRPGPHSPLQYYKRPVILTVTGRFTCPPALAERAFTITLPPLAPACRIPEMALIDAFHQAWPAILADLCNAVSTALARIPQMRLPNGKLADALSWAVAASPALTTAQGAVCTEAEMLAALDPAPPPHPLVEAVLTLIEQRRHWTGTATQLLNLLQPALSCHTPKGASHQLRSCMLTLADYGIELRFRRLHGGARLIEIRDDPGDASPSQNPPHASPVFHSSPQPAQKEALNS